MARETTSTESVRERINQQARILGELIAEVGVHALASIEAAKREAEARIASMAPAQEFDLRAAANYLGISPRTLQRRVKAREIAYRRDGSRLLFTRTAIEQYRLSGVRNALF